MYVGHLMNDCNLQSTVPGTGHSGQEVREL